MALNWGLRSISHIQVIIIVIIVYSKNTNSNDAAYIYIYVYVLYDVSFVCYLLLKAAMDHVSEVSPAVAQSASCDGQKPQPVRNFAAVTLPRGSRYLIIKDLGPKSHRRYGL